MELINTLESIHAEYKEEFDIDLNHSASLKNENGFDVFKLVFIPENEIHIAIFINSIKPDSLKSIANLILKNIEQNQSKIILNDFRLARYNHYETMDYVVNELRPKMAVLGIMRSAGIFTKDINNQFAAKTYLSKIKTVNQDQMKTNIFHDLKPAKDWLLEA